MINYWQRQIYQNKFDQLLFSGNFSLIFLKKIMLKKIMRMWLLVSFALLSFGLNAQAATPKDVLVVAQIAESKSVDPRTVTAVNDSRILMNVYDGLVRYRSGTLDVKTGLAESWTISDDGKVYTFSLRQGIKFHDGSPLNAKAVRFNFDRMLVKDHPYAETGPFPLSFFFSAIKETTVVDEYIVRFSIDDPYAPLLSNLAYPTGLIISSEAFKKQARM